MKNAMKKMWKSRKCLALVMALTLLLSLLPGALVAAAGEVFVHVLVPPSLVYEVVYPFHEGLACVACITQCVSAVAAGRQGEVVEVAGHPVEVRGIAVEQAQELAGPQDLT